MAVPETGTAADFVFALLGGATPPADQQSRPTVQWTRRLSNAGFHSLALEDSALLWLTAGYCNRTVPRRPLASVLSNSGVHLPLSCSPEARWGPLSRPEAHYDRPKMRYRYGGSIARPDTYVFPPPSLLLSFQYLSIL